MALLTLDSNRNKGINAYITPTDVITDKRDFNNNDYGTPKTKDDEQLAHRSRWHQVQVDISEFGDGLYYFKEAMDTTGSRTSTGYLWIECGEIVEEFANIEEVRSWYIDHKKGFDKLPELIGSDAQIKWATNIRTRFLVGFQGDVEKLPPECKWWIENRNDLSAGVESLKPTNP